jgi:hypothetical protein
VRNTITEFIPNPTFAEHPRDIFARNVWINPFWAESVTTVVELVGADRVCFGSDYPHPEGARRPARLAGGAARPPGGDIDKHPATVTSI